MEEIGDDRDHIDDIRSALKKGEFGRGDEKTADQFETKPSDANRFDDEKDPKVSRVTAADARHWRFVSMSLVQRARRCSERWRCHFVSDRRERFDDERSDRHGDHNDRNHRDDSRQIRRFRTFEHFPNLSLKIVLRPFNRNFFDVTFRFPITFENFFT